MVKRIYFIYPRSCSLTDASHIFQSVLVGLKNGFALSFMQGLGYTEVWMDSSIRNDIWGIYLLEKIKKDEIESFRSKLRWKHVDR